MPRTGSLLRLPISLFLNRASKIFADLQTWRKGPGEDDENENAKRNELIWLYLESWIFPGSRLEYRHTYMACHLSLKIKKYICLALRWSGGRNRSGRRSGGRRRGRGWRRGRQSFVCHCGGKTSQYGKLKKLKLPGHRPAWDIYCTRTMAKCTGGFERSSTHFHFQALYLIFFFTLQTSGVARQYRSSSNKRGIRVREYWLRPRKKEDCQLHLIGFDRSWLAKPGVWNVKQHVNPFHSQEWNIIAQYKELGYR